MKCKKYLILICFQFLIVAAFCQTNVPYGHNVKAGHYLENDEAKIYYEIYGEGQPLILLHGNGGSIGGRANYIEEFAKKYKVIAFDNRCHGKSTCPEGRLTYESMADDVFKVLDHLGLDSVFVWGHSDGGILGLILAIHHPEKVKKLLSSGANLRPDSTAIVSEIFPLFDQMEAMAKRDSISYKQFLLLVEQPNIPTEDLHKITADVLVMAGDRDVIRIEHTLEIFKNIRGALLCILPGTTHFVYAERKDWFTAILYDFFNNLPRRVTTVELMKKSME